MENAVLTVPDSYEDLLGVEAGTNEYARRFKWLKEQLDEAAESAVRGELIPIETITGEAIGEYVLTHLDEVKAHIREKELHGFR